MLCVKFEDNRTSTFCDMLRKCRNIIFFSATLRIEFRLKIFQPVHYPLGSNPHTKNCYPSLFSYKVIGKRRDKNRDVGGIHSSLRITYSELKMNRDMYYTYVPGLWGSCSASAIVFCKINKSTLDNSPPPNYDKESKDECHHVNNNPRYKWYVK